MEDYKFPRQLFPSHFNSGPSTSEFRHNVGGWGSYGHVVGVNTASNQGGSETKFVSQHRTEGETWLPTEPIPVPLWPPKTVSQQSLPPSCHPPEHFPEQMQNFYLDNYRDAFSSMSSVLGEHFFFDDKKKRKEFYDNTVHMWKTNTFMDRLQYKKCEYTHMDSSARSYSSLLHDVIHDIPPVLLGSLLYEELAEQRDRLQFSERSTGGALAYVPFRTQSGAGSRKQRGCLLYPGHQGFSHLNFHTVVLKCPAGKPPCIDVSGSRPFRFKLRGPVRQISSVSLLNECCVGVRSDHMCGVWRVSEVVQPRLLQVIQTREPATCINVSPHILGEVVVASESGAAYFWTVGKSLQKFREEDRNLYFNARSPWRWCEFSAHPRVMVYADRTGMELTDLRTKDGCNYTMFRVGQGADCRSGERVIFTRYLADAHSFHHLVTTQYSAYLLDERFPSLPMLKWDHMMQCPPMFGSVLPGSASSSSLDGGAGTTKVLLGSQRSQEITLLHYSGGRAEACCSQGPPQALLKPRDSLQHLPVMVPYDLDIAKTRVTQPAAGLACIQHGRRGECLCVLQLTEAGDIFCQMLRPQRPDTNTSRATSAQEKVVEEEKTTPPPRRTQQTAMTVSQQQSLISDTDSEEDMVGPTQFTQRWIPETPERELESQEAEENGRRWRPSGATPAASDDDSGAEGRHCRLAGFGLEVVMNDEPDLDQVDPLDAEMNGTVKETEETGVHRSVEVNGGSADRQSPAKPSQQAFGMWRKWLKKLMRMSGEKEPLRHCRVQTTHLLKPPRDGERDPMEEDRLQGLRRDVRDCMKTGSVLLHGTTYLRALEPVPVPNSVKPGAWSDELSQRLTLSWQGEGEAGWRGWWDERLGVNRESRIEALRRKRRQEKGLRRASRGLGLSGSFTSSVSYQSGMDDVSASGGWSSATSQRAWSDLDSEGFSVPETQGATSRTVTPTATPRKRPDQPTPCTSLSQTDSLSVAILKTPTLQKSRCLPEDNLRSPFGSQEEPTQQHTLEDGNPVDSDPFIVPSHQLGSLPSSQRTLRVDLARVDPSQASLPRLGLSQSPSQSRLGLSQSPSQSRLGLSQSPSQSRLGLSQSLSQSRAGLCQSRLGLSQQPKRKKSRMGF